MFGLFRKKTSDPREALRLPLQALVKEWMDGQLADLPDDERPSPQELDDDIVHMREETLARLLPTLSGSDALRRGEPDDAANAAALARLVPDYVGHEPVTPIFTLLALSKVGQPGHDRGWALCVLRLVVETWRPQAQAPRAD